MPPPRSACGGYPEALFHPSTILIAYNGSCHFDAISPPPDPARPLAEVLATAAEARFVIDPDPTRRQLSAKLAQRAEVRRAGALVAGVRAPVTGVAAAGEAAAVAECATAAASAGEQQQEAAGQQQRRAPDQQQQQPAEQQREPKTEQAGAAGMGHLQALWPSRPQQEQLAPSQQQQEEEEKEEPAASQLQHRQATRASAEAQREALLGAGFEECPTWDLVRAMHAVQAVALHRAQIWPAHVCPPPSNKLASVFRLPHPSTSTSWGLPVLQLVFLGSHPIDAMLCPLVRCRPQQTHSS